DPLDRLGFSYDVWDPTQVGRTPGTNDLRLYRMVIWRLNDGVGTADTLSAADQSSIRAYLKQGGAFFMASMEQCSRLGALAFRREVLHVADFSEDAVVPGVEAFDADRISRNMSMNLEYSQYDNFWHEIIGVPDDISDTMTLLPYAAPIFLDSLAGEI